MEEFKDESKESKGNELELDTDRSSQEADSENDPYKGDHKPVFNDTVETLEDNI